MKRIILPIALTLLFASQTAAQRRRTTTTAPAAPTITLPEAMRQYRFAEAETILNNEIATLRKKKLDITEAEDRLRAVQRAKARMRATEQICFIDSIIVHKADILPHIQLSSEVGKLDTYAHQYMQNDTTGATVYVSQMGDHRITALPSQGSSFLYTSHLVGAEWTAPVMLNDQGLASHDDVQQGYPFLLNDGTTLYYAAKGEESMGGYDIFMTRYDADTQGYLAPENIGMPFNSPANDYLFAIDEFSNLGWFVTDRNTPTDSVCIYTFIPNESRKIYNPDETDEDKLRNLARLNSIRDTWTDKEAVNKAIARLQELKRGAKQQDMAEQKAFTFVLNNQKTCHSPNDFTNPSARQLCNTWQQNVKKLEQVESILAQLRENYQATPAAQRTILTNDILTKEREQRQLIELIHKQEKDIRRLEMGK